MVLFEKVKNNFTLSKPLNIFVFATFLKLPTSPNVRGRPAELIKPSIYNRVKSDADGRQQAIILQIVPLFGDDVTTDL